MVIDDFISGFALGMDEVNIQPIIAALQNLGLAVTDSMSIDDVAEQIADRLIVDLNIKVKTKAIVILVTHILNLLETCSTELETPIPTSLVDLFSPPVSTSGPPMISQTVTTLLK